MENNRPVVENNRAAVDAKRVEMAKKRAAMEKKKALIEKRNKEIKKRKMITVLLAGALVIIAVIAGIGIGSSMDKDDEITVPQTEGGLSIQSVTESGDWVTVKTSLITFRYPFAFSDIIEVEPFNSGVVSELRFYSKIDGKRILNYSILFNGSKGVPCGTLKNKEETPVSVEFEEAPKKLSDDWLNTFYAVQETFNDVLKSMEESKNFSVDV